LKIHEKSLPKLNTKQKVKSYFYCYYNYNHFTVLWILSGTTRVSLYQAGKTNLDLLQQEIVSDNGISWAICKCAPRPRQITMPASHHSVFYRLDALSATQQQHPSSESVQKSEKPKAEPMNTTVKLCTCVHIIVPNCRTQQHRTALINFPVSLQTNIIAQILSLGEVENVLAR